MRIRSRFSVMTLAVVCLTTTLLYSQSEAKPAAPVSDEFLLLGNVNRGAGEPIIFVNPKDPNNMIVTAMATLNRLPTGEFPIQRFNPGGGPPKINPAATELRIKELSVPNGSRTDIAVTQDGGKTWTFSEDKFREYFKKNRCSDSFSGAGPDGTLYMGCLAYLNLGGADYKSGHSPNGEANVYHGGSAIAWSTDKGKTWSNPVWVHPANSPQLYPPNVHPVFHGASPWDRPMFVVDASTGTIYISGSGAVLTDDSGTPKPSATDPNGRPSNVRFRTFLRASHDKGRTWDIPMYPIDNDEYPGMGGSFSAAHGKLVVAYTASKVPASVNAKCPCTIFGTSTNDGKTFNYSVVPPLPADMTKNNPPFMGFGGVMISADPSKEGRYAIARPAGNKIMISLTEDGGKTWLPPVVAAEVPEGVRFGQRSMKYSPKGDLGLIWKAMHADRTFDLWSAASRDGGHTFKTIRVSHEMSPDYILERGNFLFGDDLSTVELDGQYLYAVWGDNRAGFQGTWFGKVPLSKY